MAEQPGGRQAMAEVGDALISLMIPDVDPGLVHDMLRRAARSTADGRDDGEGDRAGLHREYAELFALIRDVGIGRAGLRVILGIAPEASPACGGTSHPPAR